MISSYGITDIGLRRKLNQDMIYTSDYPVGPVPNLYIVADGMGGHNAGELASEITVKVIVEELSSMDPDLAPETAIEEAVRCANAATWQQAQIREGCKDMGTTVVVCTCLEDSLIVANVGDSRLYLSADRLMQITVDHSLVEEMVRSGNLDRALARTHPQKNIITRAVGARKYVDVDLFRCPIERGDTILLCSDGLSNMIEDQTLFEVINGEGSVAQKASKLVAMANANGGSDNISVILVKPFA